MAATDNAAEQVAHIAEKIRAGKTTLGIEFGSTRIKAVLIDDNFQTIASGDYSWASHLEDGLWSYTTEEIWGGLQSAYASMANDVETAYGEKLTHVGHIGFSAMMHGYLAFDEAGELLVPFRTWQNTNTHEAHEKLSELFQYNIPERWSVAHLYQAVLNHEEHVSKVDYITTLAGYVHWKLTGEKVLGVGDASGMFPIDPTTHAYETEFIEKFNALPEVAAQPWKLADLLPKPLGAGTPAGTLTAEGAKLLDPTVESGGKAVTKRYRMTSFARPAPFSGASSSPRRKATRAPAWSPPTPCACAPATSPPALRFSPWSCSSTSWRACIRKSTSSPPQPATWPA